MKYATLYLGTCLLVSGCALISNISEDAEFSKYMHHEVVLNKQVLVCRGDPLETEDGSRIESEIIYNVNRENNCPFGETIGLLPPGSTLQIEKIERHKIYSVKTVTHIYFIGRSTLPSGMLFQFFYFYGFEDHYENQPW
jgi:hypothetical protein